jgi:ligand-binding sensor domain-containing protein
MLDKSHSPESMGGFYADRQGNVWFATQGNGVVRFDGQSWSQYSPKDSLRADPGSTIAWNINSITEDSQGSVWFGTDWGLTRFDGVSWKTWRTADGLPDNNIQAIAAAPSGSVWCITAGKLCHFDGSAFTVYPGPVSGAPPVALDLFGPITVDAEGIVWVCAGGRTWTAGNTFFREGLWKLNDGTWEAFPSGFGSPKIVRGVYADDRGMIWYITTLGLASWDGKERRLYRVNSPDHVGAAQVVADRDGAVWVTSAGGSAVHSVSRFDGSDWKVFAPGITPEIISWSVQVDAQNRKWISHARYLDGDSLRYAFPPTENRGDWWNGFVVEDNGALLFGSMDKGLFRWENGIWTNYTTADGLLSNAIVPLAVGPDGTLWCSSGEDPTRSPGGHGIAWFDGSAWREHAIRGGAETVAFGKNGGAWFGTMEGVLRFDGKQWTEFMNPAGLRRPYVPSLAVDNEGNLWAATISGALRYDGKEWKRYTTADGLLSDGVIAVGVDSRNRKWFATGNGYCVLDDSSPAIARDAAPVLFALHGNHPNPFNPSTNISFTLPEPGKISLTVYDITGQKVRELISEVMYAGTHSIVWNGRDDFNTPVSSGVYLYRLQCGKQIATGHMTLVK